MPSCAEIKAKGLQKIKDGYDPIIKENVTIIENMRARGLDPTRWYNPTTNQVVNFVAFVEDLQKERAVDLSNMKEKVDDECYDPDEAALQAALDLAVLWFTDGMSAVLPKHMTHIDVREILDGNILGGENSVFNVIKEKIFDSIGVGENHEFRRLTDNPGETVGEVAGNVEREVRRALCRLGVCL